MGQLCTKQCDSLSSLATAWSSSHHFDDITHAHTLAFTYLHIYGVWLSVLNFILVLPSFAQRGNTALLLAAFGGSVELVRVLLEKFHSSLDEVNNVSVILPKYSYYLESTCVYISDGHAYVQVYSLCTVHLRVDSTYHY